MVRVALRYSCDNKQRQPQGSVPAARDCLQQGHAPNEPEQYAKRVSAYLSGCEICIGFAAINDAKHSAPACFARAGSDERSKPKADRARKNESGIAAMPQSAARSRSANAESPTSAIQPRSMRKYSGGCVLDCSRHFCTISDTEKLASLHDKASSHQRHFSPNPLSRSQPPITVTTLSPAISGNFNGGAVSCAASVIANAFFA